MLSILKYVIFALGLLAAYVLVEHYVFNKEEADSIGDSVNQAVSEVIEVKENLNNDYIEPVKEQLDAE